MDYSPTGKWCVFDVFIPHIPIHWGESKFRTKHLHPLIRKSKKIQINKVVIKVINTSKNPLPAYETSGSAGMDIRANIESPVLISPLQRKMIPTGLSIELPEGYEAQVRPRSGLAAKKGLTCLNSPGTIDLSLIHI